MKVLIATDITVFVKNNHIYAQSKHSIILKRYYENFGRIILCSRFKRLDENPDKLNDITSFIDSFIRFSSLNSLFTKKYRRQLCDTIKIIDLVVCRCPGLVSFYCFDIARKYKKPILSEAMGCAWDAYWNHGFVGKVLAPFMFIKMKKVIKDSDYATYVTNQFLQKRYPRSKSFISASNVLLNDFSQSIIDNKVNHYLNHNSFDQSFVFGTCAAIDVKYKGQAYVIKALAKMKKRGFQFTYLLVGEGDETYLKRLAKRKRIDDRVIFCGRCSFDKVLEILDSIDFYIQPSLQEGLPRALIEAMSRGCVCFGAKTGGIPELIDSTFVFKRRSVKSIINCIVNAFKLDFSATARINFDKSLLYREECLDTIRNDYYQHIRKELNE